MCWVFTAAQGLSVVQVRGVTFPCSPWASRGGGFSCAEHRLPSSGSVVVAPGFVAPRSVGSSWTWH